MPQILHTLQDNLCNKLLQLEKSVDTNNASTVMHIRVNIYKVYAFVDYKFGIVLLLRNGQNIEQTLTQKLFFLCCG